MNDSPMLLKVSDLAPLMGVSRSRIYQLIRVGALPATKVGGAIRIPRAAWLAWLDSQSEEAMEGLRQSGRVATGPNPGGEA